MAKIDETIYIGVTCTENELPLVLRMLEKDSYSVYQQDEEDEKYVGLLHFEKSYKVYAKKLIHDNTLLDLKGE